MKAFKSLLSFSILAIFISCNTETNRGSNNTSQSAFVDSLQQQTNKMVISYYVDFNKSKISFSLDPILNKSVIDSIFQYIGKQKDDSCFFNVYMKPDGQVNFYKDSLLLDNLQFVLSKECQGFYSDFTKKPKKYELTFYGKKKLSKYKSDLKQVNKIIR